MPVSKEDVIAAYRAIHLREPENQAVIESHVGYASLETLLKAFLDSDEFTSRMRFNYERQAVNKSSETRSARGERDSWVETARRYRNAIDQTPNDSAASVSHGRALKKQEQLELTSDVQADLLKLLRELRPMRAEAVEKIRVGRGLDGGYVMLSDLAEVEAAYSIGISNESSWDRQIAAMGLPVFQYDHTIDAPPETHPLLFWRKLALCASDDPAAGLVTLRQMLAQNGHERARNLILKVDIEDAEWGVFASVDRRVLRRFKQIVCELHHWTDFVDPWRAERMRRAIQALTRDHCVVHVHANNHGAYRVVAGVPLPETLEFTFARRTDFNFVPSDEVFPTALDAPNHPDFADYVLGAFWF
jgi:Methyltransferase FkbM domain